ncbi:MAG: TetR/AcrR family transcriptional regulator [Planctomycetaceae bacterium]|nr:TetR/AcrR family transcriptional regulator [Planctomycetaceae bacterium]
MPLIAQKAGVGIGTVYRYFPTKEALLNAVFLLWKKRFNTVLLAPLPEQIDPARAFQTYWERAVTWVGQHPVATRFLYLHFHGPHLDEEAQAVESEYLTYVDTFLAWGVGQGVLKPLPRLTFVALFWGSLIGLTKYENPDRDMVLDPPTFKATGDALWDALRISDVKEIDNG